MSTLWSLLSKYGDFTPEEEAPARPCDRCTPDALLAFIERLGRMPTLGECKKEFGGILGAMIDGWELQRQGRWPSFKG